MEGNSNPLGDLHRLKLFMVVALFVHEVSVEV